MAKRGRPRRPASARVVRFQTNLDGATFDIFTEVKEGLGANTHTAALRQVVRLTKWFLDQRKAGFRVVVEKEGWIREVDPFV